MIKGGNFKVVKGGTQFDTLRVMDAVTRRSAQSPYFRSFINQNNVQRDDLGRLYNALHKYLAFAYDEDENEDGEDIQDVKTAERTLFERVGNCVDYSVLLGAFLINMGVPFSFRIASYPDPELPDDAYRHIYVILDDGRPMDLVLGKEFPDIKGHIGVELPYLLKYDHQVN